MNWVMYERAQTRNTAPGVRVSKSGRSLQFTASAADRLRGVKALVIMSDEDRIGFRPVGLDHPHGYALHHDNAVAWIDCFGFCRRFRPTTSWDLHWSDDGLIIAEPPRPLHPVVEVCEAGKRIGAIAAATLGGVRL